MTNIVYRTADSAETSLNVEDGDSVMFAAVQNGVQGITGECGGVLSCATCHVYVAPDWMPKVGEPSEDEEDMLEATAAERRPNSRLSCQIEVTPELEGLIVELPSEQ